MSDLVSRLRVLADDSRKVYGLHAADCAAAMDEAASHIELVEAADKSSGSALAVIDGGFKNAVAEITRLRLTDAEREAINAAACICEDAGRTDIAIVINAAMDRLGGAT
jgi:hypothetical protein